MKAAYIGIDFGTSACRICVIDENKTLLGSVSEPLPSPVFNKGSVSQSPNIWWHHLCLAFNKIQSILKSVEVQSIAVDATSGTVVAANANGIPLFDALMYNDSSCNAEQLEIFEANPHSKNCHKLSTPGLARFLKLKRLTGKGQPVYLLHQADWINGKLLNQFGISDAHNCLKSGFDPQLECWPDWTENIGINKSNLPKVVSPGTLIGKINRDVAINFGISINTSIIAGSTDGNASFYATETSEIQHAVTVLGSTMVLKLLSKKPLFDYQSGVYSHSVGKNKWLVSGASNTGCAVLNAYFSLDEIIDLTNKINPENRLNLNYYPLLLTGERFPIFDPALAPKLHPKPKNQSDFFQAILEGIAEIEKKGYHRFFELGAGLPALICTAGGGAPNEPWRKIRQDTLNIPVEIAQQSQASYGMALLARNNTNH